MSKFEIQVPGKWILAGEHSVLRGSEALVFPLPSKFLNLSYEFLEKNLEIIIEGQNKQEIELIIWSVLERALNQLNISRANMKGNLKISANIALGGGMGASATLCVALTEWLSFLGYVPLKEKFNFARSLENLFHGESSGVDVAVTLMKRPLLFSRENGFTEMTVKRKPNLYLSYSGERGVTKDCIDKVKCLLDTSPDIAKEIDLQMAQVVAKFKEILSSDRPDLIDWIQNLKKANQCFEKWSLLTENVKQHQKLLIDQGALAVKLTGSGGGGYVLSLWDGEPSTKLPFEMIPCFKEEHA